MSRNTTGPFIPAGDNRTETDAAVAAGIATVQPTAVPEDPALYLLTDGTVLDLHPLLEKYAAAPARKTGARTVTDVDSFNAYLNKHGTDDVTELWADAKAGTILAVINAHAPELETGAPTASAGWGDHTVLLQLPTTDDWKAWTGNDGQWFSQDAFAEFIHDHLTNFATPDGATMLELAESFQSTTTVDFDSTKREKSGETTLVYRETGTATAGRAGQLAIPDTFRIGIQVHERGPLFGVDARFRYRIREKNLLLGYRLDRPGDVLDAAFTAVTTAVTEGTGHAVWHGTPTGRR